MFRLYFFDKLSSTNDKAKEFNAGSVVVTKQQTTGRGRFRRRWHSGIGGIYCSIVTKSFEANYLTIIAAISAQKAIKKTCNIQTTIKWPNDLLCENKKICGILTCTGQEKAIIGIGINTNNDIPASLRNKATSLNMICKKNIDNGLLIKNLLEYFDYYLALLGKGKKSMILTSWKKCSFLGKKIIVKTRKSRYAGIAYGIDKDCFLMLKEDNGRIRRIIEGDIFVN